MANRVYVVTDTETDKQRLVRAANQSAAIRHCATRFSAAVAAQDTLIELLADGVLVEDASATPEPAPLSGVTATDPQFKVAA